VPNLLTKRVEEELRPVIGSVLAAVSIDVEAKRIGKSVETIQHSDLAEIADNLRDALKLVVGPDMAEAAAERVRRLV